MPSGGGNREASPQELNFDPENSGQLIVAGVLSVNGFVGCLVQNEVRSFCSLAGRRKNCFLIFL
jgi:hypothetical protein